MQDNPRKYWTLKSNWKRFLFICVVMSWRYHTAPLWPRRREQPNEFDCSNKSRCAISFKSAIFPGSKTYSGHFFLFLGTLEKMTGISLWAFWVTSMVTEFYATICERIAAAWGSASACIVVRAYLESRHRFREAARLRGWLRRWRQWTWRVWLWTFPAVEYMLKYFSGNPNSVFSKHALACADDYRIV